MQNAGVTRNACIFYSRFTVFMQKMNTRFAQYKKCDQNLDEKLIKPAF